MSKFKDFLRMCLPDYWLQSNPYNKDWDALLNRLLDTEDFVLEDIYTARIGGGVVWISNHPYASFSPYYPVRMDVRPKRITMVRAKRKLDADTNSGINMKAVERAFNRKRI
jgi:hypothetical protein